jgi:hypothetical protein
MNFKVAIFILCKLNTMAVEQVTVKHVMKNKIMKLGFKSPLYAPYLDEFIQLINLGAQKDPLEVMRELIKLYERYCEVSYGLRTVFFDFAWAVLDDNPQFWNEEEKENGFSDLAAHMTEIYPELDPKTLNKDVASMEYGMYFINAMDLCFKAPLEDQVKPNFCYAMLKFFDRWSFQMGKEELEETKEFLKEKMENTKKK